MYVPAAEEAVADAFDMETDFLFRFANTATRDVNRKQADDISDQLTSVETRLADMDSMGIDIQAVSPVPLQYYYALDPDLARTSSRLIRTDSWDCVPYRCRTRRWPLRSWIGQ
jgi:aminocarboxymuconate-semialdehyde decarboxylase